MIQQVQKVHTTTAITTFIANTTKTVSATEIAFIVAIASINIRITHTPVLKPGRVTWVIRSSGSHFVRVRPGYKIIRV